MATKVIKRLGKGGYPNGRDGSAGGAGYALFPTITDGEYGTGGGFSINHGNYDVYEIQSGGGGGIKVIFPMTMIIIVTAYPVNRECRSIPP